MIETVDDIKTIANVGTGTMGHAITLQFALAGYPVHLVGRGEASLEKAMKAIRSDAEDFAEAGLLKDGDTLDAVLARITGYIESVAENLDIKKSVWAEVEHAAPKDAILSTNTSGLSPTALQSVLKKPERFVVAHFWDGMDFTDRRRALDSAFVEQNFANFASVLPYATPTGREDGVALLLDAARKAGEEQIDFLYAVAVNYLYNPESPMYNQETFLPFADWAIARGYYADVAQERRADIMKNRVGSVAADFAFELRGGGRSALKALRGTPVLLMFYEPDCSQCHEAERALRGVPELGRAIAEGELQMLAVYVGEDRKLWEEHAATLPQEWLVGIDAERAVDRRELYNIGLTPSFYLLDAEGRVQLKDGTLGHVLGMFGR